MDCRTPTAESQSYAREPDPRAYWYAQLTVIHPPKTIEGGLRGIRAEDHDLSLPRSEIDGHCN
jgi:hypothetical protein